MVCMSLWVQYVVWCWVVESVTVWSYLLQQQTEALISKHADASSTSSLLSCLYVSLKVCVCVFKQTGLGSTSSLLTSLEMKRGSCFVWSCSEESPFYFNTAPETTHIQDILKFSLYRGLQPKAWRSQGSKENDADHANEQGSPQPGKSHLFSNQLYRFIDLKALMTKLSDKAVNK